MTGFILFGVFNVEAAGVPLWNEQIIEFLLLLYGCVYVCVCVFICVYVCVCVLKNQTVINIMTPLTLG